MTDRELYCYAYVLNNPLKYIDPSGYAPTPSIWDIIDLLLSDMYPYGGTWDSGTDIITRFYSESDVLGAAIGYNNMHGSWGNMNIGSGSPNAVGLIASQGEITSDNWFVTIKNNGLYNRVYGTKTQILALLAGINRMNLAQSGGDGLPTINGVTAPRSPEAIRKSLEEGFDLLSTPEVSLAIDLLDEYSVGLKGISPWVTGATVLWDANSYHSGRISEGEYWYANFGSALGIAIGSLGFEAGLLVGPSLMFYKGAWDYTKEIYINTTNFFRYENFIPYNWGR